MAKRMRIRLARKICNHRKRYSIGKWRKAMERLGWVRMTWKLDVHLEISELINDHAVVSQILSEDADNQIFTGG